MSAPTRIRPRVQRWPSSIAYAASATFTLASAATNLTYGLAKGTDLPSSIIWGSVSVAASIVFALSWPALLSSLSRKQWAAAVCSAFALALCGTYSVVGALGSAAGTRMNAALVEADAADKRGLLQSQITAAQRELATIAIARPVTEIQAAIDGLALTLKGSDCSRWVRDTRARAACIKITELRGEHGRATRRAELQASIEQAAQKVQTFEPIRVANTDAAALAGYLKALGISTDTDTLNRLLVLLAVLTIECGGGLALAVGMALSEGASARRTELSDTAVDCGQPEVAATTIPVVNETAPLAAHVPVTLTNRAGGQPEHSTSPAKSQVAPTPTAGQRLVKRTAERDALRDRVMTTVMSSGGRLVASERTLAVMVKGTRGTTRNAVLELVAAGKLTREEGALIALN